MQLYEDSILALATTQQRLQALREHAIPGVEEAVTLPRFVIVYAELAAEADDAQAVRAEFLDQEAASLAAAVSVALKVEVQAAAIAERVRIDDPIRQAGANKRLRCRPERPSGADPTAIPTHSFAPLALRSVLCRALK